MRHGMGKVWYAPGADDESYNGSWSAGLRSGLGVLSMRNGDRYEGHWIDDKRDGPGRYFYKATNKVRSTPPPPRKKSLYWESMPVYLHNPETHPGIGK
jgi:hypothetical protein